MRSRTAGFAGAPGSTGSDQPFGDGVTGAAGIAAAAAAAAPDAADKDAGLTGAPGSTGSDRPFGRDGVTGAADPTNDAADEDDPLAEPRGEGASISASSANEGMTPDHAGQTTTMVAERTTMRGNVTCGGWAASSNTARNGANDGPREGYVKWEAGSNSAVSLDSVENMPVVSRTNGWATGRKTVRSVLRVFWPRTITR